MDFSNIFIHRPVATVLLTIGILLLGITCYRHLPVASVPSVDLPTIFVRADLPGASPETMASSVAASLERRLGVISGLSELTSVNTTGGSTIVAQFDLSRDVSSAARDVQAAINAASGALPAALPNPPYYVKANPNAFPVITLVLTSETLTGSQVYDYAKRVVAQKLSELEGVAQVEISGAELSAVRVQADPAALAARQLSLEDVRRAIAAATVNFPKGSLDGKERSFVVATDDQLFKATQFRNLIIASRDGAVVRLRDVAQVFDDTVNNKLASWWNGKRAIIVHVRKQPSANTIATVDRIRATLPLLARWLPPSIHISVTGDRTLIVRSGITDLHLTLALTMALVVMVIAIFLKRFWATAIPSVTIPVAIAGTFVVMYVTGCSIDNLSLMAITIAVGFVVDDAIVVIENIVRLIEHGSTPLAAAIRGARQMRFTVISITAALIAALIPILFMPGEIGLFFREFGITLCAAIVVSAVVSLSLTPMMCGHLLREPGRERQGEHDRGVIFHLTKWYGRSLGRALRWRWLTLGGVVLTVVATVALFAGLPKGLLPSQDTGVIRGVTEAPTDISFEAMRDRQRAVVDLLLADPAVESVTSSVGVGLWNALNTGSLSITLKPIAERGISTLQVAERLRAILSRLPGITTYLSPVDDFGTGGRAGKARYQYTLTGPNLDALMKAATTLRERMRAMPELTDVSSDQEANGLEAKLVIDRTSAARLGVSPEIIDATLYDAFGQRQIATSYAEFDQFKLVLEVDPAYQKDVQSLTTLYVPSSKGKQVPLSVVAKVEKGFAPLLLNHQGQLPAITLGFNTAPGVSIGQAIDLIDEAAEESQFPGDIRAGFTGTAKAANRSNTNQVWLLLGAIVAIYLVLGVLYESYAHPLTIISTIPSAGLGALLALWITRTELSVIAMIGLILLIGIVMKNAIMMVDFAIAAERTVGLSPRDAILRAAKLRFRPITMTTLTAALGAVPLALGIGVGAELRQPLGIAIVGGLIVSQMVTLYTTPVIYLAVNKLRFRLRPQPVAQPAE